MINEPRHEINKRNRYENKFHLKLDTFFTKIYTSCKIDMFVTDKKFKDFGLLYLWTSRAFCFKLLTL